MEPAENMKIKITKNGPYIVSGSIPMAVGSIVADADGESVAWSTGSRFDDREKCGLCRCGQSDSKPMCDGSHADANFDGTETACTAPYAERAEVLRGPRIDVADHKALCSDARFCHRDGAVWHRVEEDTAEAERIVVEECAQCPSGRYTALDKVTGEALEPALEPSIVFVQDPQQEVSGPIWARGGIQVVSAEGEPYEVRNRVTLCRCGKSQNKPFCDGSHITCGFHDHL